MLLFFQAQLESELQSIQQQNDEQFELQARDLETFQENIMLIAYDIEEMRRK